MPDGWLRFIIVLFVSVASAGICSLFLGCTKPEREHLVSLVMTKIKGMQER